MTFAGPSTDLQSTFRRSVPGRRRNLGPDRPTD